MLECLSQRSRSWRVAGVAILGLVLAIAVTPLWAGDSLYGKVIAVERADLVTLDYGEGTYDLHLVGIEIPAQESLATAAREMVATMVLDKNARMRFEGRSEFGEMRARLFTDDPQIGIKEVNVELVRAGLATPKSETLRYGYKYGELEAAADEARTQRRGVWANEQQR
ncbi:MAG: thermonuclease family protein [Acidobacteriota bacterium]